MRQAIFEHDFFEFMKESAVFFGAHPSQVLIRKDASTWRSNQRAQNGGNRGQSNHRSASAFAYGCPRAFTDRENHLPTARTVRTKAPPRRAGVCIDVVCI
jgi:hypothetical protein